MTADETALLAAVAADPGNDLPRLVYADWLDDHGQPVRAEFVRLQCRIAAAEGLPQWQRERNVHLWMRHQQLLDDHRAELVGDLPDLPADQVNVVWERGFLAEVTLTADEFLAVADRLAVRVPLPRVVVTRAAGRLDDFLPSPHLGCVTELRLDDPRMDQADERPLPDRSGAVTAAAARLTRLDTLDLSRCLLNAVEAEEVFRPPAFPALRRLDLRHNWLTDAGVIALLNLGLPQRLVRLGLDANHLTDQAAFELADRLARVTTFRTLDVRHMPGITAAGQNALLRAFGSRCNLF